ncbi:carbohydrate ABC transporter permease [Kribbella sp. NBC_01245]|uniref:carbohydrate ABC transporter permease n=1 Tax=Kribbella sp. NBC_01245 TaxID=2903578 RepID=UPI002E29C9AE|nr:carbohydrate ABC transporter permease [Kribbella sp. NBC_01245]
MKRRPSVGFWVLVIALTVVFVAPLVWMGITSFKSVGESQQTPPTIWPEDPTGRAYGEILTTGGQNPVLRWAINSFVAATLHAGLVVLVASMAGYALARMEFRFKKAIFGLIMATLFVPGFVFLMPNYLLMDNLGWLDTLWALVVPGAAGAFGVFFMRQFFLAIPRELEEVAMIDGANAWTVFTRIILPNAKPALATLTVLSFLANWNDFIWPLYVLFSPERLTLPAGLKLLQGAYTTDYPVIMTGATVASVPVLILYIFVQRYVIEGVARSGIKG